MAQTLRLLIIEDVEDDALLLVRELRKGGVDPDFVRVETRQELETALQSGPWDAVIADFNLPGFTGLDALRAVQAKGLDIPFILVSGAIGEELAAEMMKAGAHDYIRKGNFARLAPSLERELRDAKVRHERRQSAEDLTRYREHLEEMVQERTVELERANTALQAEIDKRKQAEATLRESEQRFASFMLHMPAAAWMKDMQGRYVYANAEAERVFSTPLSSLLGKTDKELFPPETARQFGENDCRVLSEGGSLQTTERLRQADGIEHHSIVNKFAVNSPDGKPAYVAGVALDITERKRMEAELEHFASFPLLNPTPIIEIDSEGRVTFCNCAAEKILGRAACLDSSNPLIPRELPDILRALQQKKDCQFTRSVEIGDLVFEVLIYLTPEFNSVRIYAMDITERRRTEEALRESEERFRTIFTQAAVGIAEVSPDRRWLRVNRKLCEIVGYTEEELKALTISDITHPYDLETSAKHYQQLLEGKFGNYALEKRYIRKDGSTVWVNLTVSAVSDASGNMKFAVGIIEDVTDKKQAKEEIDRLNADLAARAAELAAVNRELEAFNYSVAHDLRKPLTVVSGYCQIIRDLCGGQLDADCSGYLREAYDGTLRMNRLIDALLNFSRLSHVELRRERVDLSGMAQAVATELRLPEPERRVTFRIAEGVCAEGDPSLLRVVLDNLLGNAWKYTGKKEEAVIEFGITEIGGIAACFVRDNGAGFAMADAEQLFAPFARLPGVEEFRGFGIGLATVERIIRRHGGRIWAEGEPDKGATFLFSLPAAGGSNQISLQGERQG